MPFIWFPPGNISTLSCQGNGASGEGSAFTEEIFLDAGDATWEVPAGVTAVYAEVWGAGGNGSGPDGPDASGDGGGGGAYSFAVVDVTPLDTLNYHIAAGGEADPTFFLDELTLYAGNGTDGGNAGLGSGAGSTDRLGDSGFDGGDGGAGTVDTVQGGAGGGGSGGNAANGDVGGANAGGVGGGGASPVTLGGAGGDGGDDLADGGNGSQPGGGGGGGGTDAAAGGTGGNGKIRLRYFQP